jgi:CDGSH-type Zn-finger protein
MFQGKIVFYSKIQGRISMAYTDKPIIAELTEGKHAICTCGESENAPFCDGAHSNRAPEKSPEIVQIEKSKKYPICWCGKTARSPFCDGAHSV